MLEWLTGSLRPTDTQNIGAEDGASYLEELPETPAPLFAVRAFKTAIFGTPHPYQREAKSTTQPKEDLNVEPTAPGRSVDFPSGFVDAISKPAAQATYNSLASPAKGILLTPGTAATRRKTVSFGDKEAKRWGNMEQPAESTTKASTSFASTSDKLGQDTALEKMPRHSALTRTLIELSKQKPVREQVSIDIDTQVRKDQQIPSIDFHTDSVLRPDADVTIDLSQPRSRSGQHWKTEYDQYHRRSNREMKKIIKYGQNVKSYAVKKDSEASSLGEKLKKELAKVAAMEIKVSKLATELSNVQLRGPNPESDQSRLVSELAQQTALAIQYKQRADYYRVALQRQQSPKAFEEAEGTVEEGAKPDAPSELASIRAELDTLRATASTAETQSKKLEQENAALKRSLARVKEEMMSYETRRQAREERLKKREDKHKAAREECERRLAQLTVDHERLLRASDELPVVDMSAEIESVQKETGLEHLYKSQTPSEANRIHGSDNEKAGPSGSDGQANVISLSPRKRRLQKPVVDIWALSSPKEDENQAPSSKEITELPPSSVKLDINRTLKEIDQNLVPKQEIGGKQYLDSNFPKPNVSTRMPDHALSQPSITMPSATRRMHNRRTTISSPRPSMINLASSPANIVQPSQQANIGIIGPKKPLAITARSTSLLSRGSSRTNSIGSRTVTSLSSERAEAAKARLARRLAEKRRKQGGEK